MRTIEEIKLNLEETNKELKEAQEWAKSAYDRYLKDRKDWGQADYGEVDAAHSVVNTLTSKVNTLNWILELHP
jgi:hypothetical protein